MTNKEKKLPEREASVYDRKGVVARSGKPRRVANAAMALVSMFASVGVQKAIAKVMQAQAAALSPEQAEIARRQLRMRWRYGRNWRKSHNDKPHQGSREIARRAGQISRGLINPVYRAPE